MRPGYEVNRCEVAAPMSDNQHTSCLSDDRYPSASDCACNRARARSTCRECRSGSAHALAKRASLSANPNTVIGSRSPRSLQPGGARSPDPEKSSSLIMNEVVSDLVDSRRSGVPFEGCSGTSVSTSADSRGSFSAGRGCSISPMISGIPAMATGLSSRQCQRVRSAFVDFHLLPASAGWLC